MVATTCLFRRTAVVGCLLAMVAIGALTAAYGPSIPAFKAQQGIDDATAGAGLAMQSIGAVVGILLSQPLLRRRGNTVAVGASTLLVAVGSIAVAAAPSWPLVLASAVITGLGLGGCDVLITQLLIVGAGTSGPAMVNLAHACFGLGTAAAPALIAAVGAAHYRIVFAVIGLFALAGLTTLRGISPFPTPLELTSASTGSDAARPRHRAVGAVVVLGFLTLYVTHFGAQSGIGSWEPTVLLGQSYSPANATLATSGFWIAMVLGRLVAAPLSRRISLPALVVGSCIGMTCAAAVALHDPAIPWAYALAGFFIGPIFPNGMTWMAASGHAHGNRFASVIAASMVGMAVAPIAVGAVITQHGSRAVAPSILVISAFALASSAVVATLTRARRAATSGDGPSTPSHEHQESRTTPNL